MLEAFVGLAQASSDTLGLVPIVAGFSGSLVALAGVAIVGAIAFQVVMLVVRHRIEHIVETIFIIGTALALLLAAPRIGVLASSAAGAPLGPGARAAAGMLEEWAMLTVYVLPGWGISRWWQGRQGRG